MRSSTALSASAAVALLADFEMPDLNISLIAVAGLEALDRLSVSRCESLPLRTRSAFDVIPSVCNVRPLLAMRMD